MTEHDEKLRRARRWKMRRLRIACYVIIGFTVYGCITHRQWLRNNFGVVDRGRVYRSAQPVDDLPRLIRDCRLGSILNLRGGAPGDPWYANEVRLARENEVEFYDFPMSAERRPTRRELLILLDVFDRCRYPLLIHCKSGSDRTGLATSLYRLYVQGRPPRAAAEGFSVTYGHVAIPWLSATYRLHDPFNEYAAWLTAQKKTHAPEVFRRWVENDYANVGVEAPFRPLRPGPRESMAHRAESVETVR